MNSVAVRSRRRQRTSNAVPGNWRLMDSQRHEPPGRTRAVPAARDRGGIAARSHPLFGSAGRCATALCASSAIASSAFEFAPCRVSDEGSTAGSLPLTRPFVSDSTTAQCGAAGHRDVCDDLKHGSTQALRLASRPSILLFWSQLFKGVLEHLRRKKSLVHGCRKLDSKLLFGCRVQH